MCSMAGVVALGCPQGPHGQRGLLRTTPPCTGTCTKPSAAGGGMQQIKLEKLKYTALPSHCVCVTPSSGMRMKMSKPRTRPSPPSSCQVPQKQEIRHFCRSCQDPEPGLAAWDFSLAALHLLFPFQTLDKPNIILQSRHLARSSGQASQPVTAEINEPISVADFIKVYEK